MIRKIERILLLSVLLIISVSVSAQDGTYGAYSPYSIFGIGDLSKEGSAFNKGMGGVGIATRNRRFINYTNTAAVTARDTLSFMADFGLEQNNKYFFNPFGHIQSLLKLNPSILGYKLQIWSFSFVLQNKSHHRP